MNNDSDNQQSLDSLLKERIEEIIKTRHKMMAKNPQPLAAITDLEQRNALTAFYYNKAGGKMERHLRLLGALLNAALWQKCPTFLLSEPIMNEIIVNDPNLKDEQIAQGAISGTDFTGFVGFLINTKFAVKRWAAPTASRKASVFSFLESEHLRGFFYKLLGKEEADRLDAITTQFANRKSKRAKRKKSCKSSSNDSSNVLSNEAPAIPVIPSCPSNPTCPTISNNTFISIPSSTSNIFTKDNLSDEGSDFKTQIKNFLDNLSKLERELFYQVLSETCWQMDNCIAIFDPNGGDDSVDVAALMKKRAFDLGEQSDPSYESIKWFMAIEHFEQVIQFEDDIRNYRTMGKSMNEIVDDLTWGADFFGCFPFKSVKLVLERRFLSSPSLDEVRRRRFENMALEYQTLIAKSAGNKSKSFGLFLMVERYGYSKVTPDEY